MLTVQTFWYVTGNMETVLEKVGFMQLLRANALISLIQYWSDLSFLSHCFACRSEKAGVWGAYKFYQVF